MAAWTANLGVAAAGSVSDGGSGRSCLEVFLSTTARVSRVSCFYTILKKRREKNTMIYVENPSLGRKNHDTTFLSFINFDVNKSVTKGGNK